MKIPKLLIVCIFLPALAKTFSITEDNYPNGLIFDRIKDTFIFNNTITLIYSLNVSIINAFMNSMSEPFFKCKLNFNNEKTMFENLEKTQKFPYIGDDIEKTFDLL